MFTLPIWKTFWDAHHARLQRLSMIFGIAGFCKHDLVYAGTLLTLLANEQKEPLGVPQIRFTLS